MVLKTTGTNSQFQRKNRFEKRYNLTRDIYNIVYWLCKPNQAKNRFLSISRAILGLFTNQFFHWNREIVPWKLHSELGKMTIFGHFPQKWSKKSCFAEKSGLMVQNGGSFEYLCALKKSNQLKYPIHQPTFFKLRLGALILRSVCWSVCRSKNYKKKSQNLTKLYKHYKSFPNIEGQWNKEFLPPPLSFMKTVKEPLAVCQSFLDGVIIFIL